MLLVSNCRLRVTGFEFADFGLLISKLMTSELAVSNCLFRSQELTGFETASSEWHPAR